MIKAYKTVFTVTMLSTEPIPSEYDIYDLEHQINCDDCICAITGTTSEEISPEQTKLELLEIGDDVYDIFGLNNPLDNLAK